MLKASFLGVGRSLKRNSLLHGRDCFVNNLGKIIMKMPSIMWKGLMTQYTHIYAT